MLISKLAIMKKIIVPTDFSLPSRGAYFYALEIAPLWNACVKVIHVYHGSFSTTQPLVITPNKGRQQVLESWLENFIEIREEAGSLSVSPTIETEYEAVLGFAVDKLVRLSDEEETALLVMGATGKNHLEKKLIGSISLDVAQKAHCPVFLIPEGYNFKGVQHILFASDYSTIEESQLQVLVEMAQKFKASVHFVHIEQASDQVPFSELKEKIFQLLFKEKEPSFAFQMHAVQSASIQEGLNAYADENDIDLVVMVTRKRKFWDRLFSASQTKAVLIGSELPVCVLHQE
jgi:nucleotide-binding universal stress UspA family protein